MFNAYFLCLQQEIGVTVQHKYLQLLKQLQRITTIYDWICENRTLLHKPQ